LPRRPERGAGRAAAEVGFVEDEKAHEAEDQMG